MKKSYIVFLLSLFSLVSSFGVQKPMLAIPSISANGVPEITASVCRNIIETALIKTGKFSVLSYTDVEEILAAQAFTLSGCTDESCAVEIGKLLAADTIVVGELSSLGEKMNLSIRMIDVTTGTTLAAETVVIGSVDNIQESAFAAAYSLAGLKYIAGSSVEEVGELFVTAPEGMVLEVSLDGVIKGSTPVLIESIPFGVHILEAKAGDYVYAQEVSINSKDVVEIVADAALLKGNLFLSVNPKAASGWVLTIDGEEYKAGLIRNLTAGARTVSVTGNGWFYTGTVKIEPKKTVKEKITLLPAGTVTLLLPENSLSTLRDRDGNIYNPDLKTETVLPVGEYTLEVLHPDFKPFHDVVTVKQNENVHISPQLEFNEQYELRQLLAELQVKKARAVRQEKVISKFVFLTAGTSLVAAGGACLGEVMVHNRTDYLEETYFDYSAATDIDVIHELGDTIDATKYSISQWRSVRDVSFVSSAVFGTVAAVLYFTGKTSADYDRQIEAVREQLQ